MILEEIKKRGYQIWVTHQRPVDRYGNVCIKGGTTVVRLINEYDSTDVYTGTAFCSDHDNFNKKMGRQIALGRAFCKLTGEAKRREDRKKVAYPVF